MLDRIQIIFIEITFDPETERANNFIGRLGMIEGFGRESLQDA